jgi:hypothetical protein
MNWDAVNAQRGYLKSIAKGAAAHPSAVHRPADAKQVDAANAAGVKDATPSRAIYPPPHRHDKAFDSICCCTFYCWAFQGVRFADPQDEIAVRIASRAGGADRTGRPRSGCVDAGHAVGAIRAGWTAAPSPGTDGPGTSYRGTSYRGTCHRAHAAAGQQRRSA